MAKRVVTLGIDTANIRIMETNGGKVTRWASLALEPTIAEGGVIPDPLVLMAAVKRIMTSSGIQAKEVIASVSGLYSVNRVLRGANLPRGVVNRETVTAAAQEVMPIAMDELYLAWQTMAAGEDGLSVFVVGVPRYVIDIEVRALRGAGVNPRLLDLKTMALARAVNREQALIFNIEPTSFDIVLVVEGIPAVIRTTSWQQEDLTLEDRAEHLAVSLELTVGFYNSQHPGFPLETDTPLFVTGQMSGDLDLVETLQEMVSYPVTPLAPPLECPAHLPVSQYAVNIGLALKGAALPRDRAQGGYLPLDINLLPAIYKPWRPSARQIYVTCLIIAFVALLFPMFQLASGAMNETAALEANHGLLNNRMTEKQLELKRREPIQKAVNEYDALLELGGGFTRELEVIDSEAKRLGVEVQTIAHGGDRITVICQAGDFITFDSYLTALRESGLFSIPIPPPEGYPYITGGTIQLAPQPAE